MGYIFSGATKRITLTTGTTSISIEDAYSRWVDWARLSDNAKFLPAFRVVGGESDGTGGFTGRYVFIRNGWSIVPQSVNHTLNIIGNPYRDPSDLSGVPIISTVSGFTISILINRSSQAQGISTGGSAFTPSQLAAEVWAVPYSGLTQTGTIGRLLYWIGKLFGATSTSVTASNTARTTGDGVINQTITTNFDGSKTMSGNP